MTRRRKMIIVMNGEGKRRKTMVNFMKSHL